MVRERLALALTPATIIVLVAACGSFGAQDPPGAGGGDGGPSSDAPLGADGSSSDAPIAPSVDGGCILEHEFSGPAQPAGWMPFMTAGSTISYGQSDGGSSFVLMDATVEGQATLASVVTLPKSGAHIDLAASVVPAQLVASAFVQYGLVECASAGAKPITVSFTYDDRGFVLDGDTSVGDLQIAAGPGRHVIGIDIGGTTNALTVDDVTRSGAANAVALGTDCELTIGAVGSHLTASKVAIERVCVR